MNLSEYVNKRNGVPFGHKDSLVNNLKRSLGARNFSEFWNFWNPIFGYYLGMYIFKPLRKFLPQVLAVIFTFIFCGLVHDIVTTIVRGSISLFFTICFFVMSLVVCIAKYLAYNLSQYSWMLRAICNVSILVLSFLFTHYINTILHFY